MKKLTKDEQEDMELYCSTYYKVVEEYLVEHDAWGQKHRKLSEKEKSELFGLLYWKMINSHLPDTVGRCILKLHPDACSQSEYGESEYVKGLTDDEKQFYFIRCLQDRAEKGARFMFEWLLNHYGI